MRRYSVDVCGEVEPRGRDPLGSTDAQGVAGQLLGEAWHPIQATRDQGPHLVRTGRGALSDSHRANGYRRPFSLHLQPDHVQGVEPVCSVSHGATLSQSAGPRPESEDPQSTGTSRCVSVAMPSAVGTAGTSTSADPWGRLRPDLSGSGSRTPCTVVPSARIRASDPLVIRGARARLCASGAGLRQAPHRARPPATCVRTGQLLRRTPTRRPRSCPAHRQGVGRAAPRPMAGPP